MPTTRAVPATLGVAGFYRMPVETYHRIIKAGVWGDTAPFELLEGLLVNCPRPLSPSAAFARTSLNEAFFNIRSDGWTYFPLGAITTAESEPEPDFAVVRGEDSRRYRSRCPVAEEVGIVGEVSETSLAFDRAEKGRVYARAGIPVYWVVNVQDGLVEEYADPDPAADPPAYRSRADYRPGQDVPVMLDGATSGTIAAAELIP